MDKVLTIHNWGNGPLLGLATYHDVTCIYDRIFVSEIDDYEDEYYLTPIDNTEVEMILDEWKEWCTDVSKNDLDSFYEKYLNNHTIDKVLEKSSKKNKYRKKAVFTGTIGDGWIPIDYRVEWCDSD